MYGIVHPFIVDGSETFVDDKNNTYNPPIPYVTNLGPQSGYLKVASVGCGVCTVRRLINKTVSRDPPAFQKNRSVTQRVGSEK